MAFTLSNISFDTFSPPYWIHLAKYTHLGSNVNPIGLDRDGIAGYYDSNGTNTFSLKKLRRLDA
jgi:hypothetical protein